MRYLLRKRSIAAIAAGLLVALVVLLLLERDRSWTSTTMRTALDLLSVHRSMTQEGLSGFLPGTSARLTQPLRHKRFSSVSILPNMVIGTHSADIHGLHVGSSILLLKDGATNTWTVWRELHIGGRNWKSKVGAMNEP